MRLVARDPATGKCRELRTKSGKPLERLLSIMNAYDPVTGRTPTEAEMDRATFAAAPYCHQRLRPVPPLPPTCVMDLSKLTDEELAELERIMAKCQVPIQTQNHDDMFD